LLSKARALGLDDLKVLDQKAEAGDPEAETILALAYHSAVLLRNDESEALRLLHRAADQGFVAAEESLGIFYAAGIGMPQVAVYEGEPNAFATGAFKNNALVAVSTGLLQSMSKEEVEAVLGHEIGHVANGDMVTMTLIQGVLNTFVIFLSRVIGYLIDRLILKNENDAPGMGYWVSVIVLDIVLGFLAAIIVAWFSRQREFRADAASANLMGSGRPMINALARLGGLEPGELPTQIKAMGIASKPSGMMALFSSHPPIEERIAALQSTGR